jgi:glycosyltransferase involved in cell wall biosynthesis
VVDTAVSIVIPAYASAGTLAAAVNSALAQGVVVGEVIIVVDGATDGTAEVADELAHDGRVRVVLRPRNGGPSAARNDGLRRARESLVLFLDADDELLPDSVARLQGALGERDVAVAGRFVAVDDRGEEIDIGTWAAEQLRPVLRRGRHFVTDPAGLTSESMLTRLVTPPPGGVLIRRRAVMAVGGFDVRLQRSEDVDLFVRLATMGSIAMIDETVLRYRRRAHQRSAHTRQRQLGRIRTTLALVSRAPTRAEARSRARGVTAHHIDRGLTRWRYGNKGPRDVAATVRSFLLVVFFLMVGAVAAHRVPNTPSW